MAKLLYRATEVFGAACTLLGLPETWETAKRFRSGAPVPLADNFTGPLLVLFGLALFLLAFFFDRRASGGALPTRPAGGEVVSHGQTGGHTIGAIHIEHSHVELGRPSEPTREPDDQEAAQRIALESELAALGHTFYNSANRWYTAAVERRDADADRYRIETLAAMDEVCIALKAKVSPSAENKFRIAQPAEPYFSEHIPLIRRGLEINAMKHRNARLTEILRGVRTGTEPIAWPMPAAEYTGPAEFPLIRSMAENHTDRRREREVAKDRFVFLVPGGPDKSYSRADVDLLSWTQRQRLFDQDRSSEDWYRGRRMDLGSWAMVRFDDPGPGGPIWMTFPELRNLSEADRSAVLKKYNGSIRHWYLGQLKGAGE